MSANRFNGHCDYGIGIGLRIPHYRHIFEHKPVVDPRSPRFLPWVSCFVRYYELIRLVVSWAMSLTVVITLESAW